MKLAVFSSGSDGNCSLLRCANFNILIDAGLTKKQIEENLSSFGLTLANIDFLFITHEHIDHVKALPQLLKECQIKIFMSFGTYCALHEQYLSRKKEKVAYLMSERLESGTIIIINRMANSIHYPCIQEGNLSIQVLPAFHDARECIGFVFDDKEKKLVYITDTGYVHQDIYDAIANADAYVLESNHDPEILMHSSRPYVLKIRIISDHGHMSNEDSMVTLANVMGPKTKLVMHAHISQECNLTEIVNLTREKVFDEYGLETGGTQFVILGPYPSGEYYI